MTDYLARPFRLYYVNYRDIILREFAAAKMDNISKLLEVCVHTEGLNPHENNIIRELVNRYAEQAFIRMVDTSNKEAVREQTVVSDMLYTSVLFRLPENIRSAVSINITKTDTLCTVQVTHKSGFIALEPIEVFPSQTLCDQLLVLA